MGRLKQLHKDIECILNEVEIPNGNKKPTKFSYINIWNNQVADMLSGDNYSFNTPSAFIETTFNRQVQLGLGFTSYPDFRIKIHVVNDILNSENMEQNLEIFDLRDLVVTKFYEKSISNCSNLMSIDEFAMYNHGNVYKFETEFVTNFNDDRGSIFNTQGVTKGFLKDPTLTINMIHKKVYINPKSYEKYGSKGKTYGLIKK